MEEPIPINNVTLIKFPIKELEVVCSHSLQGYVVLVDPQGLGVEFSCSLSRKTRMQLSCGRRHIFVTSIF